MSGIELIHCVLYAAKSTEDRRGSIPDQLNDCRRAPGDSADRLIVAEYSDEAFSAYSGDRGPGLVDAMRHVEELAREHGTAELWAQHSDRLARGDGRIARHAVEVALWALKRNIRVRTIQDPDTFRDLLYAVVTGQRNHEDSRRKGLALAAGRRRAVERGEYTGHTADGYKVTVTIENNQVMRRLEIDEDRRPADRADLPPRATRQDKWPDRRSPQPSRLAHQTPPETTTSRTVALVRGARDPPQPAVRGPCGTPRRDRRGGAVARLHHRQTASPAPTADRRAAAYPT